jgi:hypothetical protein
MPRSRFGRSQIGRDHQRCIQIGVGMAARDVDMTASTADGAPILMSFVRHYAGDARGSAIGPLGDIIDELAAQVEMAARSSARQLDIREASPIALQRSCYRGRESQSLMLPSATLAEPVDPASKAEAPARVPSVAWLFEIGHPIAPLRQSIFDHLLDSEEPERVAQIIAAVPPHWGARQNRSSSAPMSRTDRAIISS